MKDRLKTIGGSLFVSLVFASSFWVSCFRVNNEIGPIGADKTGRQVMIQTLDAYYQQPEGYLTADAPKIRVTSEWDDTIFLGRLFQEPMRTTLRVVIPIDFFPARNIFGESVGFKPIGKDDLERSYSGFLLFRYQQPITLQAHEDGTRIEQSPKEIDRGLNDLGAKTIADLFAAWGFRRFEQFKGSEMVFGVDLPTLGRPNLKHVGLE